MIILRIAGVIMALLGFLSGGALYVASHEFSRNGTVIANLSDSVPALWFLLLFCTIVGSALYAISSHDKTTTWMLKTVGVYYFLQFLFSGLTLLLSITGLARDFESTPSLWGLLLVGAIVGTAAVLFSEDLEGAVSLDVFARMAFDRLERRFDDVLLYGLRGSHFHYTVKRSGGVYLARLLLHTPRPFRVMSPQDTQDARKFACEEMLKAEWFPIFTAAEKDLARAYLESLVRSEKEAEGDALG